MNIHFVSGASTSSLATGLAALSSTLLGGPLFLARAGMALARVCLAPTSLAPVCLSVALLGSFQNVESAVVQDAGFESAVSVPLGPLAIPRGVDKLSLPVPRDEELTFKVEVDLGFFDVSAGTVTMNGKVEPWKSSLLLGGESKTGDVGLYRVHAKGKHNLYNLDATIETRLFPQDWPRVVYRYTHEGSERRRREIQLGSRGGTERASYRSDTKRNAPAGQRVWGERNYRDVPRETVDMLSAVYLSRRLIESGKSEIVFPLIDKLRLWKMVMKRGPESRVKTPAGTFDCVRLELAPGIYETEKKEEEEFKGLFGLCGSIILQVEKQTGIPVLIQGDLPAGPFTFQVSVALKTYRGTPANFAPTPSK